MTSISSFSYSFVIASVSLLVISCLSDQEKNGYSNIQSSDAIVSDEILEDKIPEPPKVEALSDTMERTSRLPLFDVLTMGKETKAEVVSKTRVTDAYFNNTYRVIIKNNYDKAIRSVRISTNLWVERGNGFSSEKVRFSTETVVVTIPSNESREIILRKDWDLVQLIVDAVTFTDGTADSSIPPSY